MMEIPRPRHDLLVNMRFERDFYINESEESGTFERGSNTIDVILIKGYYRNQMRIVKSLPLSAIPFYGIYHRLVSPAVHMLARHLRKVAMIQVAVFSLIAMCTGVFNHRMTSMVLAIILLNLSTSIESIMQSAFRAHLLTMIYLLMTSVVFPVFVYRNLEK